MINGCSCRTQWNSWILHVGRYSQGASHNVKMITTSAYHPGITQYSERLQGSSDIELMHKPSWHLHRAWFFCEIVAGTEQTRKSRLEIKTDADLAWQRSMNSWNAQLATFLHELPEIKDNWERKIGKIRIPTENFEFSTTVLVTRRVQVAVEVSFGALEPKFGARVSVESHFGMDQWIFNENGNSETCGDSVDMLIVIVINLYNGIRQSWWTGKNMPVVLPKKIVSQRSQKLVQATKEEYMSMCRVDFVTWFVASSDTSRCAWYDTEHALRTQLCCLQANQGQWVIKIANILTWSKPMQTHYNCQSTMAPR